MDQKTAANPCLLCLPLKVSEDITETVQHVTKDVICCNIRMCTWPSHHVLLRENIPEILQLEYVDEDQLNTNVL